MLKKLIKKIYNTDWVTEITFGFKTNNYYGFIVFPSPRGSSIAMGLDIKLNVDYQFMATWKSVKIFGINTITINERYNIRKINKVKWLKQSDWEDISDNITHSNYFI